ncbi:MAG: hypothetical protein CMM62_00195 [Rhodospirillaceae bacterium]|jgi:hypothetical protein|nr:hypothetical protein [Rhodospirillaceae bacterium]MAX65191.1 hypothetical protein [Rhodospirillaceae bacterium]MBB58590.1 hypothetical protein [Rhodospirillaceae bacterium]|tara:strand:- start:21373 stop:21702 length:330 start_codon:yes stop_codon:yes gene_type:complete
MAKKGLGVAVPPPRRTDAADSTTPPQSAPQRPEPAPAAPKPQPVAGTARKAPESTVFDQTRGTDKVQINLRVSIETRNAFKILAIELNRKQDDLFAEAVSLLEAKYGSV